MAFFIAYFLLIPLFFLDIFVAIIIEGFEQSSNKANNLIQEEDYEHFRECWVKFDRDVRISNGHYLYRELDSFLFRTLLS